MTTVLDDDAIARAMRAAERALAARDPNTLAGRFSPRQPPPEAESGPARTRRPVTAAE